MSKAKSKMSASLQRMKKYKNVVENIDRIQKEKKGIIAPRMEITADNK
jgi:hypothetical protein